MFQHGGKRRYCVVSCHQRDLRPENLSFFMVTKLSGDLHEALAREIDWTPPGDSVSVAFDRQAGRQTAERQTQEMVRIGKTRWKGRMK